ALTRSQRGKLHLLSRWTAPSFQNSRTARSGSTRSNLMDTGLSPSTPKASWLYFLSAASLSTGGSQVSVEALRGLPENTVIDGEVVALDGLGRPVFNMLQNFRGAASHIHYFVFDLLVYKNRDLTRAPLTERRGIMRSVLPFRSPQIRLSDYFETSATD